MVMMNLIANDHGSLSGLGDDDHSIYALLAGRSGGQALIGGTGTTDGLTLQTTSGIGATGADIRFLVGNNGATEAMTILNNGDVGKGTTSPDSAFHIKANIPGTVGSHPAGQIIIQNPANDLTSNVVITAYESDASGNPDQQLWYLGSSSSSNENITLLNRRSANLALGTNGVTRLTVLGSGNININNFTELGSTAPAIKMKKLTGTTNAAEGGFVDIAHGLTVSKILAINFIVEYSANSFIPDESSGLGVGYIVSYLISSTNIRVINHSTDSENVLSKPFKVLITYEE